MSKGQGKIVTLKFTEPITTENVSTSLSAFTVTGQEYKFIHGPLLNKTYTIQTVQKHPSLGDNYIQLIMNDLSRFPTVEGDLTVEYDATIGNLVGQGGGVESFTQTFTPEDLIPEPNPNQQETIEVAPVLLTVDLLPVEYVNRFTEDTITIAPVELTVELIHISIINP